MGYMVEQVGAARGGAGGAQALPILGTTKTSVYSTTAESRFAVVVLDSVLEPLRLAHHT